MADDAKVASAYHHLDVALSNGQAYLANIAAGVAALKPSEPSPAFDTFLLNLRMSVEGVGEAFGMVEQAAQLVAASLNQFEEAAARFGQDDEVPVFEPVVEPNLDALRRMFGNGPNDEGSGDHGKG